jgi:predicted PurR-regulated permease PerM
MLSTSSLKVTSRAEPQAAPPESAQVPAVEMPGLTALVNLAVGVVAIAGLFFAREVQIPITLAVVLSFLIAPLVRLLGRLHVGRVPAVLLSVVTALALIVALGTLIGT